MWLFILMFLQDYPILGILILLRILILYFTPFFIRWRYIEKNWLWFFIFNLFFWITPIPRIVILFDIIDKNNKKYRI